MKTSIYIGNVKGGTGKTTISLLIGEYYRQIKKKKVLMIDLDYQQVNTCQYFATQAQLATKKNNLYNILNYIMDNISLVTDKHSEENNYVHKLLLDSLVPYPTENDVDLNFCVIASNIEFGEISSKILKSINVSHLIFKVLLDVALKYFDVVIIDTPPGVDFLPTQSALLASRNLLIVTDVGEFGVTGLAKIMNTFKGTALSNTNLNLAGILVNKVKQSIYDTDFLAYLREVYDDKVLKNVMYDYVDYKQSLLERKFILTEYKQARGSKPIENVKNVLDEIDSRIVWFDEKG